MMKEISDMNTIDRRTFIGATIALSLPALSYENKSEVSLAIKYGRFKNVAPVVCELKDLRKGDIFRFEHDPQTVRHKCLTDAYWSWSDERGSASWAVIVDDKTRARRAWSKKPFPYKTMQKNEV